jgi:hypothetical protein
MLIDHYISQMIEQEGNIRLQIAYCIIAVTICCMCGLTSVNAQGSYGTPKKNFTDLVNTGINIVEPELPETLLHRGLKADEVRRFAKAGVEAAGWPQNQGSPYYVLISISEKSASEAVQVYSVQADWGYDQIPVVTNAGGMNGDVSFTKIVTITNSQYAPMLTAIQEMSQKAAAKLRSKLLNKFNYPKPNPLWDLLIN